MGGNQWLNEMIRLEVPRGSETGLSPEAMLTDGIY